MTRLAEERGLTLTELLVALTLMLIISAAALTSLEQFTRMSGRTERRIDQQDHARQASREIARALRNIAAAPDRPDVVERAGPYDIVFKTVAAGSAADANTSGLRRVRYCLDTTGSSRALRAQTQTWTTAAPPAMPSTSSCPDAAWGETRVIGEHISNRADGQERPLFTYRRTWGDEIDSVAVRIFVDGDPAAEPREAVVESGVFLRNQNRAPVAAFSATPAGLRHLLLNASESIDPDGQPLDVRWFVGGADVGSGMTLDYLARRSGPHVIEVEVSDPAGLVDRSAPQTVVVP